MRHFIVALVIVVAAMALPGCKKKSAGLQGAGKGGSLARFAIQGQVLYTLGGDRLSAFSLEDPERPLEVGRTQVKADAETLFLAGDLLYVGARTGLYVYSVEDPERPAYVGEQRHLDSCDPVVVQGSVAYVTLRSGQRSCPRGVDELRVYDVSDPTRPRVARTYPMRSPSGLGVDGELLFVVDGSAGLKVYDTTDPMRLRIREVLPALRAYDVIPNDGVLIVSAADGLYQYDYRDGPLRELSRVAIGRRSPRSLFETFRHHGS